MPDIRPGPPLPVSGPVQCPKCKNTVTFMQVGKGLTYCPKCNYEFYVWACSSCRKRWNSKLVKLLHHRFLGKDEVLCPFCHSSKIYKWIYRPWIQEDVGTLEEVTKILTATIDWEAIKAPRRVEAKGGRF